ncbi:MAG: hypothetical protein WC375_03065 [Methanomassiliicoccales archaeon]|jgi:flagellar protein FlaF
MGLSVSAATAILFTAAVITFSIVFGAMTDLGEKVADSQDESIARYEEIRGTSISIVSVDGLNDSLLVRNDGAETITLQDVDVLVNGTLCNWTMLRITVEGHAGSNIWAPGESILIELPGEIENARVKVTAYGWASDHVG